MMRLLTTRRSQAALPAHEGQARRTLGHAWNLLGRELAYVLAGLLLVAPLAVLGIVLYAGQRLWRRRDEARLLATSRRR